MNKTLYRSCKNKVISGVCGGLGEYFAIDPVIMRIIFVIALFVFPPAAFFTYIILWIVLPCDKVPEAKAEEAPAVETQEKTTSGSASVSIIIAVILIIIGIFFLIPGSFFRFGSIAAFLIAFFLVFIAGKLGYEMTRDKNYSLIKASIAFISLSYGVFIVLNQCNIIGNGIFFEYAKNLIPAILIILGIAILFKNISNKLPALILASFIFIFIGAYSFINGNYSPFGFMGRMFEDWKKSDWRIMSPGNRGRHMNFSSFSSSYTLPEGIDSIDYNIENSGGNLKIDDTQSLLEYNSDGLSPSISTNLDNKIYTFDFNNRASDTKLKLNNQKNMNLSITVSAGNLEGNLQNLNIQNLNVSVNGGAAKLELGENVKKVSLKNNIGSTEVRLPRNAKIKVHIESALAHMDVPNEFKNIDGEYIYNGGTKEIEIDANVSMGNLELRF